ncbi:MAG: hypothetical protein Q7S42_04525 [Candidatus Omnitrophota bacterium]|nr:hypothetical protein [Candidatus Omnitrophota bacterium]
MISLLLLNIPVVLSVIIIVWLYFRNLSLADTLLCCATVYFSYIVLVEQILGILNILTIKNLELVGLGVLAAVYISARLNKAKLDIIPGLKKLDSYFPYNKWGIFIISVIFAFSLVKIIYNLVNPPFGWDSLNYHFTFAVEWFKSGNLNTPLVVFDNPCPSYYPLNGSLIYLWFIFPLKSVFLADLGQLPFFVLTFIAIFNLCRKLGALRSYSFFAAALLTITPNYFKQLSIAYVDVMVCAWFLIALNFLFNLTKRIDYQNTLLFGLSLGMLIGTKSIALVYSFILIFFFFYLLIKNKFNLGAISHILLVLGCVLAVGGYGYIRNFLETGNPLYPTTFQILGKTIFPGVMDKSNFISFLKPEDYSLSKILFHEGMGVGTLLFVLTSVPLFVFTAYKKKKFTLEGLILALSFVLLYFIYRYIFSLPNIRYLYPLVAVGYVLTFYALSNLRFSRRILLVMIVVCFFTAMPEMARKTELVISLSLFLFILPVLLFAYRKLQAHFVKLVFIGILASCCLVAIENINYNKHEFERYAKTIKISGFWPDATVAWDWLNKNTLGNNIAYAGRPVPFPLYGTNFKNNVYYVSVNKTDPVKLEYFPHSFYKWGEDFLSVHKSFEANGNYRSGADYSTWLTNLKRRGTDYLFVYSLHQTREVIFPMEDIWARGNPDRFRQVFNNPTIHIYRVVK